MSSNKPFPSSDLDVFKENSLILDQFVNSQDNEHPDRFNRKRPTITGIIKEAFNVRTDISNMNETLIGQSRWDAVPKNTSLSLGGDNGALNKQAQALFNRTVMLKAHAREALRRTYQEVGLNLVEGSFEQGGTLNTIADILLEEKTGKCYSWSGSFPKVVSKGTLPTSEVEFVDKAQVFPSRVYLSSVIGLLTTSWKLNDVVLLSDRSNGRFIIRPLNDYAVNNLDILPAGPGMVAVLDLNNNTEVNLSWVGCKLNGMDDDTVAFERAVMLSSLTTNGNLADMRAGCVSFVGDLLLNNAFVRNPGLTINGSSNGISRLCCKSAGTMLTVHPLRGDTTPYTNTGYGGLFLNNCQVHALSEEARNTGTGLVLINCFNTNAQNLYVSGFKNNIVLKGSHFIQFRNFYAADEKNSYDNPNEEIFNRGYAIAISTEGSAGETESTGMVIDGGWIHNSSLNLENASNYTVTNIDIEPASNSVMVGAYGHWHNNRFERMDYYAINTQHTKYPPFAWFIVGTDGSTFENNSIHSLGATNDPAVNPKFKVTGNSNKFYFNLPGIRFGLISFGGDSRNNHVEIGPFEDLKYFAADGYSPYYVENCHIYKGYNTHKLCEHRSYVESHFDSYTVKNCLSVPMNNSAYIQGLSRDETLFTVTNTSQCRIILNYNTTEVYTPGMYCLKFRLTGNDSRLILSLSGSLDFGSAHFMPLEGLRGGYCFIRFEIKRTDLKITPTLTLIQSVVGASFRISDLELLKFDSGEYVKNNYVL